MTDRQRLLFPARLTRRDALVLGASSAALALGGLVAGPASPAAAAVSPRLPGEIGRQNNLVSRYGGAVFDHIRVAINGDNARLFIPQGIVPGSQNVPVLWFHHGAQSSDDALLGGFRGMGERATDLGMIAICQNLGGTLYTSPVAKQHQANGWNYLSGLYGIDRNFLRGTSHGGAMAAEVLVSGLIPNVVGSYIVNGVYDIEKMYLSGTAQAQYSVGAAFGNNLAAIRANNPARHLGPEWTGKRVRVVYSTPDSSDTTTPPPVHAKALLATAGPHAVEASARTHTNGHNTPGFADTDNQATILRWMEEILEPEPPAGTELIASWEFAEASAPFASTVAGAPVLVQGTGSTARRIATPFGSGVEFNGTKDYLRVARDQVGSLNLGATTGAVTVAAWVYSTDTNAAMIAGCWQETAAGGERAYALFNDLPTYGGDDQVCMHVSATGGVTPGYSNSRDYATDPRKITRGTWQLHVGTYDGAQAIAYLNGTAEPFPTYTDSKGATYAKNPYLYADGINAAPTDFLVGSGLRNGAPVNQHKGVIAKLRVWNGALTPADVLDLYTTEVAALAPPTVDVPAPLASWDFAEAAGPYASAGGAVAALQQGTGSTAAKVSTPFGGGVEFNGTTDYLVVPVAQVGALNIGATTGRVTVAAWVYSTDTNNANIAGCWQETTAEPRRSYALFNDLPVYGGDDMVCMEVSKLGGATPGYPYSIDYAAEPRKITRGTWQLHVGTYDGAQAVAYLDGVSSAYPTYTDSKGATYAKNPYAYPNGLNAAPTDFMVGAVVRGSSLINLHKGRIAKLRVWNVALTPEQIKALYDAEKVVLG
jgi:hypothetical protein